MPSPLARLGMSAASIWSGGKIENYKSSSVVSRLGGRGSQLHLSSTSTKESAENLVSGLL